MSSNDDGHSPKTCNYVVCKADVDTPCPFVRDQAARLGHTEGVCETCADTPVTSQHEHQYTIPVLWKSRVVAWDHFGGTAHPQIVYSVTTLRCACGREIGR
jgi:hypothetical protein